jgi:hypothetical protein
MSRGTWPKTRYGMWMPLLLAYLTPLSVALCLLRVVPNYTTSRPFRVRRSVQHAVSCRALQQQKGVNQGTPIRFKSRAY